MRLLFPLFMILGTCLQGWCQLSSAPDWPGSDPNQQREYQSEHGTCQVTAVYKDRISVAIDSLVSNQDETGNVVSRHTGCKMSHPSPEIVVTAIGLSAFAQGGVHWDALGSAVQILKREPLKSWEDTDRFSKLWAEDLIQLSRRLGKTPSKPTFFVADLDVFFSKMGRPAAIEVVVHWDGASKIAAWGTPFPRLIFLGYVEIS